MKLTFRSTAAPSPGYRAEIDGLRAVAVLGVVFYHLGSPTFRGGFVGVDVFFVISGYLITQVIQNGIARGNFSLLSFYDRRIRRIIPALAAVALVSTAVAVLVVPPVELALYGRSLLAMTGFCSNYFFAKADAAEGYFTAVFEGRVLLHTWSLALEEQFYVLFPLLLMALHRLARRFRLAIILGGIVLSFAFSVWGTSHHPITTFYLLPGRAWELLIGAFLTLKSLPALRNRIARELASAAGLGMIVFAVLTLSRYVPFPGMNALLPCLGAWLVLYATESGQCLTRTILSFRPLVFFGVISYSLYLWHWPVIVFFRYVTAIRVITRSEAIVLLFVSILLAFLSFEFVESPFRRRPPPISPRQSVWGAAAISAILASIALVLIVLQGLPQRMYVFNSSATSRLRLEKILAENEARKNDWSLPPECSNFKANIRNYSDAAFCRIGDSQKNILFWGDSHVGQMYSVIKQIQPQLHGEGIVFAVDEGCPFSQRLNTNQPGFHCDDFNRFALQRALKDDIDTVFIEFSPWWARYTDWVCAAEHARCVRQVSTSEASRIVAEDLAFYIDTLRARGKRVIVGLPFPRYDKSIPEYEIALIATFVHPMSNAPAEIDQTRITLRLKIVAQSSGAEIFDPRESLCPGGTCIYQADEVSLYEDDNHIAASQSGILIGGLLKVLLASR